MGSKARGRGQISAAKRDIRRGPVVLGTREVQIDNLPPNIRVGSYNLYPLEKAPRRLSACHCDDIANARGTAQLIDSGAFHLPGYGCNRPNWWNKNSVP